MIQAGMAQSYLDNGLNVLPLKSDKRPNMRSWKKYQSEAIDPSLYDNVESLGLTCTVKVLVT